jgi:hypothetical protein
MREQPWRRFDKHPKRLFVARLDARGEKAIKTFVLTSATLHRSAAKFTKEGLIFGLRRHETTHRFFPRLQALAINTLQR